MLLKGLEEENKDNKTCRILRIFKGRSLYTKFNSLNSKVEYLKYSPHFGITSCVLFAITKSQKKNRLPF
jgi:hypothetical protein